MLWRRPLPIFAGKCRRAPRSFPTVPVLVLCLALGHPQRAATEEIRSLTCADPRTGQSVSIHAIRVQAGVIDSTWQPDSTRLCIGSTEVAMPLAVGDGVGG